MLCMLENLALLRKEQLRFREAVDLQRRVLQGYQEAFGKDNERSVQAMFWLACDLDMAQDYDAALELYKQALAAHEAIHGPDNPRTIMCTNWLSGFEDKLRRERRVLPKTNLNGLTKRIERVYELLRHGSRSCRARLGWGSFC